MTHSRPAAAASGRPNTGAATQAPPAASWIAARRRESSTLIVLMETWTPVPSRSAKPPVPVVD